MSMSAHQQCAQVRFFVLRARGRLSGVLTDFLYVAATDVHDDTVGAAQVEARCFRAEKALREAVANRDTFVKRKVAMETQDLRDENAALRRRVGSLQEAAQISKVRAESYCFQSGQR